MSHITQIDTSARIEEEALHVRDEKKPNDTVEDNDFYNRCLRFKKKKTQSNKTTEANNTVEDNDFCNQCQWWKKNTHKE